MYCLTLKEALRSFPRDVARSFESNALLQSTGKGLSHSSPTVVLFYEGPCPISQTSSQVFITQQTNHRLSKIVRRVSQNEIFARLDWQTLGAHGCGNDGFSRCHCFKNF